MLTTQSWKAGMTLSQMLTLMVEDDKVREKAGTGGQSECGAAL